MEAKAVRGVCGEHEAILLQEEVRARRREYEGIRVEVSRLRAEMAALRNDLRSARALVERPAPPRPPMCTGRSQLGVARRKELSRRA